MLVVANGAWKSGSTWLYNILCALQPFERPPETYLLKRKRYQDNGNARTGGNPCIRPDRMKAFLDAEDYQSVNYISKNHLDKPEHRELLLGYRNVYVFDIERNLRDMVVSSYYDECNRHGYDGSFDRYYWEEGRYVADYVQRYHDVWRNCGPTVHIASYESLKTDFFGEVEKIAEVLGISLDEEELKVIQEKTSINKLRERYSDDPFYKGDRFFRKGIIGDWKNHMDTRMIRDVDAIERRGIHPFDLRSLARRGRRVLKRLVRKRA
jgi:hypothetical protein